MDAMALLCTLHADGPTTLRRLRASGFRELGDLESAKLDSISEVLEVSAAAARRFVREAAALRARVGEESLESEPSTRPTAPDVKSVEHLEPSVLSSRDQRLVDQVLTRWRESDAEDSMGAARAASSPTNGDHRAELQPDAVDGLTAEICQSLAEAGIETLAALSKIDPLVLRAETGLGFSTLCRLQFLARRAAQEVVSEERLSVADRPVLEGAVRAWELEPDSPNIDLPSHDTARDAGGPFA